MRNRSTLEFLGVWEQMNNPNFKVVEFDHFKMEANLIPREITKQQVGLVYAKEADLLNMALFGITAKEWREVSPQQT